MPGCLEAGKVVIRGGHQIDSPELMEVLDITYDGAGRGASSTSEAHSFLTPRQRSPS